jgi:hypothetical protein
MLESDRAIMVERPCDTLSVIRSERSALTSARLRTDPYGSGILGTATRLESQNGPQEQERSAELLGRHCQREVIHGLKLGASRIERAPGRAVKVRLERLVGAAGWADEVEQAVSDGANRRNRPLVGANTSLELCR